MKLRTGPQQQAERWLRRSFELAACDDLEYCLLSRMTADNLSRFLEIRGVENLTAGLSHGKGAILYSGHVRGHYTFFAALGLLGYTPNVLGRLPNVHADPFDSWFFKRRDAMMRRKLGCRFLVMSSSNFGVAVQAANALRRNEVVTVEIDNTNSKQNLEVTFLNGRAKFPVGPLLLAKSTGAPLLDFFLRRGDPAIPLIADIGPPLYVGEDLEAALQTCVTRLERSIFQYPPSWALWLFPQQRLWDNVA